mgnify:FL=1
MEPSKDLSKHLKIKYRDSALEFISDDNQVDVKIGTILTELKSNGEEQYASAIEDLTLNEIAEAIVSQNIKKWLKKIPELKEHSTIDEIVEAALNKDITKWSQKIEEIKENQAIICICPGAKITSNTYEEINLSLSEITDSQIHKLMKMFTEHSIKITVKSSLLLVRIIKDSESR